MTDLVARLRSDPRMREAVNVSQILRLDPIAVLEETDTWRRAARLAATEMVAQDREEARHKQEQAAKNRR